MTTTVVFYPHAVRATLVLTPFTELFNLSLLEDLAASHNYSDLVSYAAAQVGPQMTGSHMAAPDFRFSTPQLGTLLGVTIGGEYGVVRDLSLYNVDLWYREGLNLGMRTAKATPAHLQLRGQSNAMLALESITADDGQLAQARARLGFVLNSQTGLDPLVPTGGLALAGIASGGSIYTLGPVKINGTLVDGANYCGCDFGLEYDEESSHGDGFLTYLGVRRYRPVFTMRARKTDYMVTFGTRGTTVSSFTFYLRQKLASGINVADGVAQHIKITANTGTIKARGVQGDKSLIELTVEPYQSAEDTAPVTIAVNQTIT